MYRYQVVGSQSNKLYFEVVGFRASTYAFGWGVGVCEIQLMSFS